METFICKSRYLFIFITAIFVCLIYSFLFTPLASATALIQFVRMGESKTLNSMLGQSPDISNIEGGCATVLETAIDYNHIEVEKNQAYIL
ncbi:MAG: hypothetical protein ABIK92_14170 [Pseudomonadota bacterium]